MIERLKTVGRVASAGSVAKERECPVGRVVVAGGVVKKRKPTVRSVVRTDPCPGSAR